MAKISIAPADLKAAARLSWEAMFERRMDMSWDLTMVAQPEAIDAHEKLVKAILEYGGDLKRAIPAATAGKFKYGYGGKTTVSYHDRLAAWLKDWANRRGL